MNDNYSGTLLFFLAILAIMILALIGAQKLINYLKRKEEEDKKGDKNMAPMCFEVKLSDKQGAGGDEFKVTIQASSEADAVNKVREKYKHAAGIYILSVKQL